jgi:hypothetical protein
MKGGAAWGVPKNGGVPNVLSPGCCNSAMLDPADPSGSAREQDAAARPHTNAPAALKRGGTQDLG